MLEVYSITDLRLGIESLKEARGVRLGLVPTMGNLHDGHLYLVEQSIKSGLITAVSIFVNPIQFDNAQDLSNYPRTLKEDLNKLKAIGCDLVFIPSAKEMYPNGMQDITQIVPASISSELEGAFRPGHFNGMATVVCKLFNLFLPEVAFFGQKDFQQLAIVKQMVADLNIPVKIQSVPTQRSEQGLALSSRNSLLNAQEQSLALHLYESLSYIAQNLVDYQKSGATLEMQEKRLNKLGFEVEYLQIREANTFEMPKIGDENLVVLVAARLGAVRLIDNLPITLKVVSL